MTPIYILLTTYQRTEYAIRTIRALKNKFHWPNIGWWISDDGSPPGHVEALVHEIGPSYNIQFYNSARKGVGHGMNVSLQKIFDLTPLVLVMEDDWELNVDLDMTPYVSLLENNSEMGMIRFGYISPNIQATTISAEGKLFWRFDPNGEQYRFSGHPALRHARFHQVYGYYDEGLSAGYTELSMCGKVNAAPNGPSILYPVECGAYGFFGHIGTQSLAGEIPTG
jgi:hypothetical protein